VITLSDDGTTVITSTVGGPHISTRIQGKPPSVTIPAGIERVGEGIFRGIPFASITLPANVSDSDLRSYGFESNFVTFYTGQNRAAGTYNKNGPIWSRSSAGGID
jgi:hypothetical protein